MLSLSPRLVSLWQARLARLGLDVEVGWQMTFALPTDLQPGRLFLSVLPHSIGILPRGKLIFLTNLPFFCIYATACACLGGPQSAVKPDGYGYLICKKWKKARERKKKAENKNS